MGAAGGDHTLAAHGCASSLLAAPRVLHACLLLYALPSLPSSLPSSTAGFFSILLLLSQCLRLSSSAPLALCCVASLHCVLHCAPAHLPPSPLPTTNTAHDKGLSLCLSLYMCRRVRSLQPHAGILVSCSFSEAAALQKSQPPPISPQRRHSHPSCSPSSSPCTLPRPGKARLPQRLDTS